ncbi:MAG: response regulator [Myxococcaceae bacterium]|nr:response regulator [Myxococcaceae bacterium]
MSQRVLIAEDDAAMADTLRELLAETGFDVLVAASGAELQERLVGEGPFDLVVADIGLPWVNGLQAMHRARWHGVRTPVVFVTGHDDPKLEDWVAAFGPGASLLHKPFSGEALLDAARRLAPPPQR